MSDRAADRILFLVFGAGLSTAAFLLGFVFDHLTTWVGWKP